MKHNWVSTKDKLPEMNQLVVTHSHLHKMDVCRFTGDKFYPVMQPEWCSAFCPEPEDGTLPHGIVLCSYVTKDSITHWAPVPAAGQAGEQ